MTDFSLTSYIDHHCLELSQTQMLVVHSSSHLELMVIGYQLDISEQNSFGKGKDCITLQNVLALTSHWGVSAECKHTMDRIKPTYASASELVCQNLNVSLPFPP